MPRVFNKRRPSEIPSGAVYVGRPTQWGNPFRKGSKTQNIADFKAYAEKRHANDPNWLKPLRGKHLVCWCSPAGCHGDVLIAIANSDSSEMRGTPKNKYRYERAAERKQAIETHQYFLLFREYLDLLAEAEQETAIDKEISEIERLEYDAFDPTR